MHGLLVRTAHPTNLSISDLNPDTADHEF